MRKGLLSRLLLGLLVLLVTRVFAAPITWQQAERLAREQLQQSGKNSRGRLDIRLLYTSSGVPTRNTPQEQDYYVFGDANEPKGFVIVSGEDSLPSILGYSEDGVFEANNIPEDVQSWLSGYSECVRLMRKQGIASITREQAQELVVAPLLRGLSWNQDEPYNDKTPIVDGKRTPTGCVATAATQIMRYFAWPEKAKGKIDNLPEFGTKAYRWDAMPNICLPTSSEEVKDAVSTLMREFGAAVNMKYSATESGAQMQDAYRAFLENFDYSPALRYLNQKFYTNGEWEQILKEELKSARPILYAGLQMPGGQNGHAFVCDGYDGNGYFHFNWGWGGAYNGYFRLYNLAPHGIGTGGGKLGLGYSYEAEVIVGFEPSVKYKGNADRAYYTCEKLDEINVTKEKLDCNFICLTNTSNTAILSAAGLGIVNARGERVLQGHAADIRKIAGSDVIYLSTISLDVSNLADGQYTIVPLGFRADKNEYSPAQRLAYKREVITLTVTGGQKTVKRENTPRLSVSLKSTEVYKNITTPVTFTVRNTGSSLYYARLQVAWGGDTQPNLLNTAPLYNDYLLLDAGEERTIALTCQGPSSDEENYLYFFADPENKPSTNLCTQVVEKIKLTLKPDYSIDEPVFTLISATQSVKSGDPVQVTFKISGANGKGAIVVLRSYIVHNGRAEGNAYEQYVVLPGETRQITISKSAALRDGIYTLRVELRDLYNPKKWKPIGALATTFRVDGENAALPIPSYKPLNWVHGETWYSYCNPNVPNNKTGTGKQETYDLAVQLSGSDPLLKGKKIKGIRFSIRQKSVLADKMYVWASKNLPNKLTEVAIYRELLAATLSEALSPNYIKGGMNEILFDTPFEIPATGAYLGYTFTVTSSQDLETGVYPIALASALADAKYFMRTSTSSSTWTEIRQSHVPAIQVLLEGDFLPVAAEPSDFGKVFCLQGKTARINIPVKNIGKEEIKNITYTITTTKGISSPKTYAVAAREYLGYNTLLQIPIEIEGDLNTSQQEITITLTDINGKPNEAPRNSARGSLATVAGNGFERNVLVEEFTSTLCGLCPRGHVAMEAMRTKYKERFVGVALHRQDSTDPMYLAEYKTLKFGGAPQCIVDRGLSVEPAEVLAIVAQELQNPAMVQIHLKSMWDEATETIKAEANIESKVEGEYRIAYILVADEISGEDATWKQRNFYASTPWTGNANDPIAKYYAGGLYAQEYCTQVYNDVALESSYVNNVSEAELLHLEIDKTTKSEYVLQYPKRPALQSVLKDKPLYLVAVIEDAVGRVMNVAKVPVTKMSPKEYWTFTALNIKGKGSVKVMSEGSEVLQGAKIEKGKLISILLEASEGWEAPESNLMLTNAIKKGVKEWLPTDDFTVAMTFVEKPKLPEPPQHLSVEDAALAKVLVTPNPFVAKVYIVCNGGDRLRYELYNLQGMLVRSGMTSRETEVVEVADLPTGLYLMKVTNLANLRRRCFKLIK